MPFETSRAILIKSLLASYDDLKRILAQKIGSEDAAADALHDTFVRLNAPLEIGAVKSPRAYLLRIALRLAAERRRSEQRGAPTDAELLFDVVDDAPDPARIVEARSEIERLKIALTDMPRRRRAILIAAAVDDMSSAEIAARFGVTRRTVQIELRRALVQCAALLGRAPADRRPARPTRSGPIASAPDEKRMRSSRDRQDIHADDS